MPDTTDYLTRMRDYAQGKDPLELQKQTPTVLAELVAKASDEQLSKRPSTDKWSVGEILAHLAEDEIATAWRYRQMVEHPGLQLAGFDQDLWARLRDYASRVPHESLALSDCFAARIYNCCSRSKKNSGNALASMSSVVPLRSAIWSFIWRATMLITSTKSAGS